MLPPGVPRVSVITPAHNAGRLIERALRSVAAQTYTDWEVIVVDDASTDDTAERARATGVPRIVLPVERNIRPAAARNLALREATGELVTFLDADDEWLPEFLERQVALYDAERVKPGPPVGIVACDARLPGAELTYFEHCEREHHLPLEPLDLERVLRRNPLFVSSLTPRTAVEEVGGFDEELFGPEDHDLWLRILERGYRVAVQREVLCFYHQQPDSVTSNLVRMAVQNQMKYERALARGRLPEDLRRVARRELRYNRAMEGVAGAVRDRRLGALGRVLPEALLVAATNVRHWGTWLRVLRS